MRIAFVGPPQSGKSTLFRAVTGQSPGPHHAIGEQLAVVKVPDRRLDYLAELYKPKKYTEATMDCLDVPGHIHAPNVDLGLAQQEGHHVQEWAAVHDVPVERVDRGRTHAYQHIVVRDEGLLDLPKPQNVR